MSRSHSEPSSASSSQRILVQLGKHGPELNSSQPNETAKKQRTAATQLEHSNTQEAIEMHGTLPTLFQGESYEMLSGQLAITPNSKVSCRGRSAREIIILDLQSPALAPYLKTFLSSCEKETFYDSDTTQPLSEEEVVTDNTLNAAENENKIVALKDPYHLELLKRLLSFVRSILLNPGSELALKELIKQEQQKHNLEENPIIAPLDWFLTVGKGYCRHQTLLTAYLLVNLIAAQAKESASSYEDTKSRVYRFRTKLKALDESGKYCSHAVVIYEAENGHRYLLDPANKGTVIDLSNLSIADKDRLQRQYSPYNSAEFIQKIKQAYDSLEQQEVPAVAASDLPAVASLHCQSLHR